MGKVSKGALEAIANYDAYVKLVGITEQVLDYYLLALNTVFYVDKDPEYGKKLAIRVKTLINTYCKDKMGVDVWKADAAQFERKERYKPVAQFYDVLKIEAQHQVVDSYFQYLERNREPKDRFYSPKRNHFLMFGITRALQGLIDDKYDILSISMPPGTGKTTTEKFFLSGVIGWFPKDYNLFYSHSSDITRMFYDGVYQIVSDKQEYTWSEIFPDLKVTSTNAKMQQFNVSSYKPFPSLQCTSLGSESAGKVRASKFLCVDDMIGKLEEALNKSILEKLWGAYTVDARQRKTVDSENKPCKEIHISTRWSTEDIIGRLQRVYEGNERTKFIAIPDVDKETGLSNFDYAVGGFTVEYFNDIALTMDDISYRCLYKQEPIEREGLLYNNDELRRYRSLPDREPDAVLAVCDTKTTGMDYMVLPIVYQYDSDYYLVDCVCDNSTNMEVQEARIANKIVDNKVMMVEFESNAGGAVIASNVEKRVKEIGWTCTITSKPTETNKETRIIVNADWVKRHVLFKEQDMFSPKDDYGSFMGQLISYSITGKNRYDDVCDALANLALFVNRKFKRNTTRIIRGGML